MNIFERKPFVHKLLQSVYKASCINKNQCILNSTADLKCLFHASLFVYVSVCGQKQVIQNRKMIFSSIVYTRPEHLTVGGSHELDCLLCHQELLHRVTAYLDKLELCSHLHKIELCYGVRHTHVALAKSCSPQITNFYWNWMASVHFIPANCGQSECNFRTKSLSLESCRNSLDSGMMSEVPFLCWIKAWIFFYKILSTQNVAAMAFFLKMHCNGVTTITPEPHNNAPNQSFSVFDFCFLKREKSNDWCWLNVNMPAV